ncbi:MAG: hypothetical protein Q9Q40_13590 [Acidobacteriota bacterium]|nr:hypothetical protein [Acidobacteriota bacterium]
MGRWLSGPVSPVRALKAGAGIAPGKPVTRRLRPRRREGERVPGLFADRIAGLVEASGGQALTTDPPSEPALREGLETVGVIIPMEGAVDPGEEAFRREEEPAKPGTQAESRRTKLSSAAFVERAPAAGGGQGAGAARGPRKPPGEPGRTAGERRINAAASAWARRPPCF